MMQVENIRTHKNILGDRLIVVFNEESKSSRTREQTVQDFSLELREVAIRLDDNVLVDRYPGVRIVLQPSGDSVYPYVEKSENGYDAEKLFDDVSRRFHEAMHGNGIVDLRSVTGPFEARNPAHNNLLSGYTRYP